MRAAVLPRSLQWPTHPRAFSLGGSRVPGLGSSFQELNQIPEFQSAWGAIQSQLSSEGASSLDIAAAQNDLASSFDNLTSGAAGFGLSASDALSAATQYVTAGRTVIGAVKQVQGLLAATQNADPAQNLATFQAFTGTLIGAATAAGALSAGVGAVIVAGLGIAINLLESVGLFGSPPPNPGVPYYVGPNGQTFFAPQKPAMTVGGVYSLGAVPIAVGSPHWRHFPDPSLSGDAGWFSQTYGAKSTSWAGASGGTPYTWACPGATYRLIDAAFWDYFYITVCSAPSPTSFQAAFLAAWKANKEYALNGLQVQPDWQVLAHTVRLWNRAHTNATFVDVVPYAKRELGAPALLDWRTTAFDRTACPAGLPPFFTTVVQDLLDNTASSDPILVGGKLRINQGPIKKPALSIHLRGLTLKPALNPAQTGALAVVGTALAVAAGGSLYAFLTNQAIGYFWGKVFDGVVDGVKGILPK